jgi:hypothetical protein
MEITDVRVRVFEVPLDRPRKLSLATVDELTADYEIFEVAEEGTVQPFDPETEPECPELGTNTEEELAAFCLYREEDGYCSKLGQACVILDD